MTLALLPALIWTGLIWWMIRRRPSGRVQQRALMPAAFLAVILGAPALWQAAASGYPGDSFWTLDSGGRFGVIAISTIGLCLIYATLAAKTLWFRALPLPIGITLDIFAGLAIYIGLYTVSPQVFCSFYQLIFPDLPHQIVVRAPDAERLWQIAVLRPDGSLSDHLAGIGLWAVVPFTLWQYRMRAIQIS